MNPALDQLIDDIVRNEFPEDYSRFQFEKKRIYERFDENYERKERNDLNQFGIPVESIPEYLGVVISIVSIGVEFYRLRRESKKAKKEEVELQVREEMAKYKLSNELITKLTEKYIEVMTVKLNGQPPEKE